MEEEILPHLIIKYGDKLNPKISSVLFQQGYYKYTLKIVFTEIRGDYSSYTTNLDIIQDLDDVNKISQPYFKIEEDFTKNKEKFIELDDYSKAIVIDNLFNEEYLKSILYNNDNQ